MFNIVFICSRGETGRHLGLRSQFCKKSAGSNPVANTCYFHAVVRKQAKRQYLKYCDFLSVRLWSAALVIFMLMWCNWQTFFTQNEDPAGSSPVISTCYFYAYVMQLADIFRLERRSCRFESCRKHSIHKYTIGKWQTWPIKNWCSSNGEITDLGSTPSYICIFFGEDWKWLFY